MRQAGSSDEEGGEYDDHVVKKRKEKVSRNSTEVNPSRSKVVSRFGKSVLADPFSKGTFETDHTDIPEYEVNSQYRPVGHFWQHIRAQAFVRAAMFFDWDIPWSKQPPELKMRFRIRLKSIYKGEWDDKWVMQQVGNNLREKRVRIRKVFKKAGTWKVTPLPYGLKEHSARAIFATLQDPKHVDKSEKCKVAADARTAAIGYTHKLGPGGVKSLLSKFVSYFYLF